MISFFRFRGVTLWILAVSLAFGLKGGDALAQTAKKPTPVAKGTVAERAKDGQVFGDWVAKCGQGGCVLSQSQVVEGGARLIQFTIGRIGTQGEQGAIAIIPLGIHIPAGALLAIDGKATPMTLKTCMQQGCQATMTLDAAQLGEIGKAQAIEVIVMDDANRENILIPLSIKGLGQGLAAIR